MNFRKWYFGHFHKNRKINQKFSCLYNEIEKINLKPRANFAPKFANLPGRVTEAIAKFYDEPKFAGEFLQILDNACKNGEISGACKDEIYHRFLAEKF